MERAKQNLLNRDQTLKDLLDLHKKDVQLSINCMAIATIQSFDATKQTVTATINYKKTFMQPNAQGTYDPVLVDYPVLIDCPVIISQGGGGVLTFPIIAGDTCLILFNDRDIDNWYATGQVGPIATQRLHSFADGFALVGVRALPNAISGYDTQRIHLTFGISDLALGEDYAKLQNGESYYQAANDKLKMANDLRSFKDIMSDTFTTLINAFNTPTNPPPVALNAPAAVALGTRKTEFEELFE